MLRGFDYDCLESSPDRDNIDHNAVNRKKEERCHILKSGEDIPER